jgi:heme-degrading monooxygenase HmoA
MIAVIFEFEPDPEHREEYFDVAGELRPLLDEVDGFVSIERFESLTTPGKTLSLSFWRDEEAVRAWRNTEEHRKAQAKGRARLFQGYRLRVASVLRDYSLDDTTGGPEDSKLFHNKQ